MNTRIKSEDKGIKDKVGGGESDSVRVNKALRDKKLCGSTQSF